MDETYVGRALRELTTSPDFLPYGKVVLWRDDENAFSAEVSDYDTSTHRTLEADCPYATQAMANAILSSVSGYVYRPYEGDDALLDPAAELGDGVTIDGFYSGIFAQDVTFDQLCASDISAPQDEELDHEYPYADPVNRALARKVSLGTSYYGTKITRDKGLTVERVNALGSVDASVVLNADELSFYAGSQRVLYFNPASQKYIFNGDIIIQAGSIEWADLSASAQSRVDSGKISEARVHTLITSDLVASPNIAGGKYWDIDLEMYAQMIHNTSGTQSNGSYGIYYPDYSTTVPIINLEGHADAADNSRWATLSCCGETFITFLNWPSVFGAPSMWLQEEIRLQNGDDGSGSYTKTQWGPTLPSGSHDRGRIWFKTAS